MNNNVSWLGLNNPFLVDAGNGHRLHQHVLPAFQALQSAAARDGVDCQLVSSFRSFERQLSIWNRKWCGELPLYDASGTLLITDSLNENEKIDAILTWSALPGGSRHHWGTDIDVFDEASVTAWGQRFDLVDSEYRVGGPCYALAKWLDEFADEFGFVRPFLTYRCGVACELWHLSHQQTASEFEAQRDPQVLADALQGSDMRGKAAVLARLDELYPRFVLNRGIL